MGYTLYVDEVGHANYKGISEGKEQYLSLTGVVLSRNEVQSRLIPRIEALKEIYCSKDTKPVVLHRHDIINKFEPFHALNCPVICGRFDENLMSIICETEYLVITVVLDKIGLQRRYFSPDHPYHYGLRILLERYVKILEGREALGDIIVEARGKREDQLLIKEFSALRQKGTDFVDSKRIKAVLVSKQLKLRTKHHNVAGLQLADIIAHPSYKAMLARRNGDSHPNNFGGQIAAVLEREKYHRGRWGRIDGYGCKWLP